MNLIAPLAMSRVWMRPAASAVPPATALTAGSAQAKVQLVRNVVKPLWELIGPATADSRLHARHPSRPRNQLSPSGTFRPPIGGDHEITGVAVAAESLAAVRAKGLCRADSVARGRAAPAVAKPTVTGDDCGLSSVTVNWNAPCPASLPAIPMFVAP